MILQSTIFSRLNLMNGSADLILLVIIAWSLQERVQRAWIWAFIGAGLVAFVSAQPPAATVMGYLAAMIIARTLHRRVWQAPVLAMFVTTAVATILQQLITLFSLNISGTSIALGQGFARVILPSAVLNLLLVLPIYALVTDFAAWVYPAEEEG